MAESRGVYKYGKDKKEKKTQSDQMGQCHMDDIIAGFSDVRIPSVQISSDSE